MRVWLIIAFFVGILTQQHAPTLISLTWVIGLIPLFLFWYLLHKRQHHPTLALGFGIFIFYLLGIFWTSFRADVALSHRLNPSLEGIPLKLVGTIVSIPERHPHHVSFILGVDNILIPNDKIKPSHLPRHIRLSWYSTRGSRLPSIRSGQQWGFTVRLRSPYRPQNPHTYDGEIRNLETKIDAFGSVVTKRPTILIQDYNVTLRTIIARLRETIARRIQQDDTFEKTSALMLALSIGEQSQIDPRFRDLLSVTGTSHLIAISGLHVSALSLLTATWAGLWWRRNPKRLLKIPLQQVMGVIASLTAISYAAIAGFGIPVQRSALMVITACLLLCSRRSLSGFSILMQALLVVVLFDPWAPFFPGFWLSFGTVALIILNSKRLTHGPRFHRIKQAVYIQIMISLTIIPMTWWFFQQISLVSVLANLIAIPYVTFIIVPSVLITALIDWSLFSLLTHYFLKGLIILLTAFGNLPGASFTLPKPPVWTLLFAMGGIWFWLIYPKLTYLKERLGKWGGCLGFLGILPMILGTPSRPNLGEVKIVVFDIGQGNAAIVQTQNHNLVIDTGPYYPNFPPPAQRTIVPYLKAEGIKTLDGIMITHKDSDHSGGLQTLIHHLPIHWILSPEPLSSAPSHRQLTCRAGMTWTWDEVNFDILYPTETDITRYEIPNDRGCVLKITTKTASALFPGDLAAEPLRMLATSSIKDRLSTDILMGPHHGSVSSSPLEFIRQVRPKHVIFSSGYKNRYDHPNPTIVERYKHMNAQTWRTDQDGAIIIELTEKEVIVQSWREINRRYWYTRQVTDFDNKEIR